MARQASKHTSRTRREGFTPEQGDQMDRCLIGVLNNCSDAQIVTTASDLFALAGELVCAGLIHKKRSLPNRPKELRALATSRLEALVKQGRLSWVELDCADGWRKLRIATVADLKLGRQRRVRRSSNRAHPRQYAVS